MRGLETAVLGYLLNSLWQAPLVFCAAWLMARLARPAGPKMEHRVWVGALLLEAVLPACEWRVNEVWQRAWGLMLWFGHGSGGRAETHVIVGAGAARTAVPWLPAWALTALAGAYAGTVLYWGVRLAWGVGTTERLRRRAVRVELTEAAAGAAERLGRLLGADGIAAEMASSAAISGPAVVGIRQKTLLLPPGFLEKLSAVEVDALVAHEMAHVVRHDFAKNLVYGVMALPVAYHPAMWITRARLAETRELVCDAMAAAAVGGRESYARSLLRLARMLTDGAAPRILQAIGILDGNIFERRVMNLTRRSVQAGTARRMGLAAACVVVGLVTCASAMALRMTVAEPGMENSNPTKPVKVDPKEMQSTIVSKVPPVFPADEKARAKETKTPIDVKVVLDVTIGKEGEPENIKVATSKNDSFSRSALEAVRQWKWKPYLVNGEPVVVETTVTVIYQYKP